VTALASDGKSRTPVPLFRHHGESRPETAQRLTPFGAAGNSEAMEVRP